MAYTMQLDMLLGFLFKTLKVMENDLILNTYGHTALTLLSYSCLLFAPTGKTGVYKAPASSN